MNKIKQFFAKDKNKHRLQGVAIGLGLASVAFIVSALAFGCASVGSSEDASETPAGKREKLERAADAPSEDDYSAFAGAVWTARLQRYGLWTDFDTENIFFVANTATTRFFDVNFTTARGFVSTGIQARGYADGKLNIYYYVNDAWLQVFSTNGGWFVSGSNVLYFDEDPSTYRPVQFLNMFGTLEPPFTLPDTLRGHTWTANDRLSGGFYDGLIVQGQSYFSCPFVSVDGTKWSGFWFYDTSSVTSTAIYKNFKLGYMGSSSTTPAYHRPDSNLVVDGTWKYDAYKYLSFPSTLSGSDEANGALIWFLYINGRFDVPFPDAPRGLVQVADDFSPYNLLDGYYDDNTGGFQMTSVLGEAGSDVDFGFVTLSGFEAILSDGRLVHQFQFSFERMYGHKYFDADGNVKTASADAYKVQVFCYSITAIGVDDVPYSVWRCRRSIDSNGNEVINAHKGDFLDNCFKRFDVVSSPLWWGGGDIVGTWNVHDSTLNGNVVNAKSPIEAVSLAFSGSSFAHINTGSLGGGGSESPFTLLASAFGAVGGIMSVYVLPGLTIGTLMLVPLVAVVVFAVIKILSK